MEPRKQVRESFSERITKVRKGLWVKVRPSTGTTVYEVRGTLSFKVGKDDAIIEQLLNSDQTMSEIITRLIRTGIEENISGQIEEQVLNWTPPDISIEL